VIPSSARPLVEDPCFPLLKRHLLEHTGLSYYADKDADLAGRLAHRLAIAGIQDCASYFHLLRDSLRGPSELDALIAEITIGETYFFRHQEHFDALRDQVLPDIISRNRSSRSLRIWCAGCADGPEPYSLSILLKRELAHQLSGWAVTILGTDINRHNLARAREAKFEEWALRSTPDQIRQSCFTKEGRRWSLAPKYKAGVSFQYHNLVEHSFPSLVNNLCAFDLIVCRNVMIYFASDLMRRIVAQFHESLVPGAWLLVGPSEPNMTSFTSFRIVNAHGLTLYLKPDKQEPAAAENAVTIAPPPSLPSPPVLCASRLTLDDTPAVKSVSLTLDDARGHADRGAWEEAAKCCEELLAKGHMNSGVHFYQGLVLEQMGRHAQAERSLRRAIYLDRHYVLAHYYLGLFLQARGDPDQAARSFENALALLRSRSDAETFADADGITAAELRKLAAMQIETLLERAS
jgi:chemotaxis protein methyltransferase CheR